MNVIIKLMGEKKLPNASGDQNLRNVSLPIETLPLGCIVWNLAFQATTWNRTAERIFGYAPEEVIGKSPELLFPPHAEEQLLSTWRGLLEGYNSARVIRENIAKAGRRIICEWIDTPLRSPEGTTTGILSLIQDVT